MSKAPTPQILGVANIGDDTNCPHCNGFKDPDDDICEDCANDFNGAELDEDSDDDWGEE